jgi:hypothetical protein
VGDLATRWAIRAALLSAAFAVAVALIAPQRRRTILLLWTAGCVGLWVHILCAFHFQHQWSYQAAVEHTNRRSHEFAGFSWDGAILLNFATAVLWTIEVAAWSFGRIDGTGRVRFVLWGWWAFLAFMVVNGAIVFERGPTRWVSLAVAVALGGLCVWRRTNQIWSTTTNAVVASDN